VERGPIIYSVTGVTDVAIAAGTTLGPIAFRFPEARFVTGLLAIPRSGSAADLALVRMSVTDEDFDALVTDRGLGPGAIPLLALTGGLEMPMIDLPIIRAAPLQRPVAAGDFWRFSLTNDGGAPITLGLFILFDPAEV
jgi:hypothetical protein